MEEVNIDYLDKHKKFRIDNKKLATAFIVSAFVVAIIVFWWLKLIGITVTGDAFCGLDEHIHSDDCYTSEVICGFEEDVSETTETDSDEEEITEEETTAVQQETSTEEETEAADITTTQEEVTTEDVTEEATAKDEKSDGTEAATEESTEKQTESTTESEASDDTESTTEKLTENKVETTTEAEETKEETTEETTAEATEEATEETTEAVTEPSHKHTDECYRVSLTCTKSEHTHTEECFPDFAADVETVSDWLSTLENIEITNDIVENLIAVAMSQVGYEESTANFEFDDEGNKNGYTRYGEWYGNPYGDWNTMFVSFCLHYSNINNDSELKAAGAEAMRLAWQERKVYSDASEHTPKKGDIAFIDEDYNGIPDTVAVIISPGKESLVMVIGDSNNSVETVSVELSDKIIGYGLTGELSFAENKEYSEEDEEEKAEQATAPEEKVEEEKAPPKAPLMMMSATTGENEIIEHNDITTLLTDARIETLDGQILGNDSVVYIGQTYKIYLSFSESNKIGEPWHQFKHDEEHHLHYKIPDNIVYERFEGTHPISAEIENGTIEDVGEYYINEDGVLVVIFKDDENDQCFASKYSDVSFTIDFTASVGSTQSGSTTNVVFNDEIKVNLTLDPEAEMDVTKTMAEHNPRTNTIDYTVTIKGTKGAISDLIVYDDMYTENNQHALKDTIVVTDLNGNVLEPQPTITDGRGNNNFGFTLTGFPNFSAGEGYIITYQTALNDNILDQESVEVWNGVYPEGKKPNNEKVTASDTAGGEIPLSKIAKQGKQTLVQGSDGTSVEVIEWEVEIRKNDVNLNGTVLIDILGDGLEYYKGKNIKVYRYDATGENFFGETEISWNDVDIQGNQMSFPLPDGYRYKIVYYTTFGDLGDDNQEDFTNEAIVEIEGEKESTIGNVNVVGYVPNVRKSASGDDGEYVYFTIESDIPAVIKDWGGFFLTDYSYFWNMDFGTYNVDNKPEDIVITAQTVSGKQITFTPYAEGGPTENTYIYSPASYDQYHSFYIFFNTSTPNSASSKWILDEDATLKVTYKLPFDSKLGTNWTGEPNLDKTVEDVLFDFYALSNDVYLNFTNITSAEGRTSYTYSPMLTKKATTNDDGTIDYTVIFNNTINGSGGNQGYLTSGYSINFNDTFDERLEYVEGSLMVTCYDPWNSSVWYNKYVYDGKIPTNTMSVPADKFNLSQTNPALPEGTIAWISPFDNYQTYCNRIGAGGKHVFTYKLKLKDKYLYSTEENKYVLDNTAELKWSGDKTSGPATDTVEIKTGLLDKHAVQKDNRLLFDIHINRYALDILNGSDTIMIEDTMTHNLSVYWDTIKLLYEDKQSGEWIDFDSENSQYTYNVVYDQVSNKLTFTLPDSLHIRIDYTTLITESGHVSVNNAVKVDGKASVTDIIDATFNVEQHSGSASGSMHEITLIKQDGDTDVRLSDTQFHLYGPMGDPKATLPDGAEASIISDSGVKLNYIGTYTTGTDGTSKISTQYLSVGGPYALVESAPPEGYMKLEKPVYFYFYEPDLNGVIQTVTTLIAVENYTYGFVLPETGGTGILPLAIIGVALMAYPILYSTIRRKRERRLR